MKISLKSKHGFTLIEILAVILIIGMLAAIFMPAFSGILRSSRNKLAKSEEHAIANAIKAYTVEYAAWPCPESDMHASPDVAYSNDNWKVMDILDPDNDANSRELLFIETDGYTITNISGNDVWIDPWQDPYVIVLDTDGDGFATHTVLGNREVSGGIAIYSRHLNQTQED